MKPSSGGRLSERGRPSAGALRSVDAGGDEERGRPEGSVSSRAGAVAVTLAAARGRGPRLISGAFIFHAIVTVITAEKLPRPHVDGSADEARSRAFCRRSWSSSPPRGRGATVST